MSATAAAARPPGRLAPALPRPGQRLIVAGGCGGIGRSIVEESLALGLGVIVLDLQASIEAHPPPSGVLASIGLDAGNEAEVGVAFETISRRWPAIDALVNLVGFTREQIPVETMSAEEWDGIVAGNLRSAFLISRAAAPGLRASAAAGGHPAMVLTSSTFGVRVSRSGYGPYAASKAGVIGLCKALSTEWAPQVRVNCIAPGLIRTAFLSGGTGRPPKRSGIDQSAFVKTVPLARIGEALDITGPALFLLSEAAGYITGQTLHVNGGSYQA
jgi:NAD(P)-dependent dehydrogenase (short-subunit alcohol dehydrogenase family)